MFIYILLIITQLFYVGYCSDCTDTICNPRAGDLLIGREGLLSSSSTCGLKDPEKFCIVIASDRTKKPKCDICYSRQPYDEMSNQLSHRIENVVSRLPRDDRRWWQSENGVHNVSIEINFESEFQFIYTHLRFKTYRPAAMYIERSKDYGKNWQTYAYFSDKCSRDFPNIPTKRRSDINEVSCTSEFSSISPSEGGNVLFVAEPADFNIDRKLWNKKRNDVTAITNLRVNFVRLHTFGDWRIDDNPSIKNKYYYAISEWIIRGRCSCYGHASRCKPKEGQIETKEMVFGVCECQHNTIGQHCEKCKDFYNDRPWLPADRTSTNECKRCNCNDHATACHFNPIIFHQSGNKSGGLCDNCQHNTEGKNCERCQSGYYRNLNVPITSPDTCLKCKCHEIGSKYKELCVQENDPDSELKAGSCICKDNITGYYCDRCKNGYWDFKSSCKKCKCMMSGTIGNAGCDQLTGDCKCKVNVQNSICSECKTGYFNLSSSNPTGCMHCGCNPIGSDETVTCNKNTGQCICKPGFTGRTCSDIKDGWFVEKTKYPLYKQKPIVMELDPVKNDGFYNIIVTFNNSKMEVYDRYVLYVSITQDKETELCKRYDNTIAISRDDKNFIVPNHCLLKDMKVRVTVIVLEKDGKDGKEPSIVEIIVIPQLYSNSTMTRNKLKECLSETKKSKSKECEFVRSEISTNLKPTGLPKSCQCNVTGSVNNICNKIGGQCQCFTNVVGRKCDKCAVNTYGYSAHGCKECGCVSAGSLSLQCDSHTGQCICRNGVNGKKCDSCKQGFWNYPYCEACKCHSLASTCDQKTGECINCRENSFGFNCQQCIKGYYGNPASTVPCLKCKCPGLQYKLDHSNGCNLIFNTSTYACICKEGYKGRLCNQCDNNYFGNPVEKDGMCKPCTCSGNINKAEDGNCDSSTGECLKCLYNTQGFNCEKCIHGYYGDGSKRTCKKCACNPLGTDKSKKPICDGITGECNCLPNVIGSSCDDCLPGYYNITSGKGCIPCDCNYPIGSKNKICNMLTGQCQCNKGRSGRRCNQCEDGFWGKPEIENGCKKCECNKDGSLTEQCNRENGKCICKKGVMGRYCDQCDRGTSGALPNCLPCGECWDDWYKAITKLEDKITKVNDPGILFKNFNFSTQFQEIINIMDQINKLKFDMSTLDLINKFLDLLKTIESYPKIDLDNKYAKEFLNYRTKINEIIDKIAKSKIKDIRVASGELEKLKKRAEDIKKQFDNNKPNMEKLTKNVDSRTKDLLKLSINDTTKMYDDLKIYLDKYEAAIKAFRNMICKIPQNCQGDECNLNNCEKDDPNPPLTYTTIKEETLKAQKLINEIMELFKNKKPFDDSKSDKYKEYQKDYPQLKTDIDKINQEIPNIQKTIDELKKTFNDLNNGFINEEQFNKLLEKVKLYKINVDEGKIKKLENDIKQKQQKLMNVDEILKKSQKTREQCSDMKKKVEQLKTETGNINTMIDKSKENIKKLNEKPSQLPLESKVPEEIEAKQKLINEQNDKAKQNIIDRKKSESEIENIVQEIQKSLKNIQSSLRQKETEKLKASLIDLNNKKAELEKKQKESESTINKKTFDILTKLTTLQNNVANYSDRMTKKEGEIQSKYDELMNLQKSFDEKKLKLMNLQKSINDKSKHQQNCLV